MIRGTRETTQVLAFEQPLAGMISVVRADQGKGSRSRLLFRGRLTFVASGRAFTGAARGYAPTNLLACEGCRILAASHDGGMLAF